MKELSVLIPCYNEENNILPLVEHIVALFHQHQIDGEVVLINDGSSDQTGYVVDTMSHCYRSVKAVHHRTNKGITASWASGLAASRSIYIVTIDADFQYCPDDIITLYNAMVIKRVDVIHGWRKNYWDTNIMRRLLSRLLSAFLNRLFSLRCHDIKSGFVLCKPAVFNDILKDRKKFITFQHFYLIGAVRKGYTVHQVPITFYSRTRGTSFIRNPFLFSCKILYDLPRALITYGIYGNNKKRTEG